MGMLVAPFITNSVTLMVVKKVLSLGEQTLKKILNTLRDTFLFILFKSNLAPISITIGVP